MFVKKKQKSLLHISIFQKKGRKNESYIAAILAPKFRSHYFWLELRRGGGRIVITSARMSLLWREPSLVNLEECSTHSAVNYLFFLV